MTSPSSAICPPGQHIETICQDICVADPTPVWEDLGVVPVITASPSVIGKRITQLHPHGGSIYLGYGEWTDTKQPGCDVVRWTGTAYESLLHVPTDAIWNYRTVNGDCWAIVTDPEVGADPDAIIVRADGSLSSLSGSLSPYPWHLFDAIHWQGRTYVAGADRKTGKGTVWRNDRRSDGREIWPVVLAVAPYRMFALFAHGTRLYATDSGGTGYWTEDGVTWTALNRSAANFSGAATKPMAWHDAIIFRSGYPAMGDGVLYRFDGQRVDVFRQRVRDHYVDGDTLWTLELGGVYRDGLSAFAAPDLACSIAADGGWLYAGTEDSHLWRRAL